MAQLNEIRNESNSFSQVAESMRLNSIRKQIWEALLQGQHLTIVSAQDLCGTRDLRSNICMLRQRIEEQNLPYVIRDKWLTINRSTRIKEYWMEGTSAA